MVIDGYIKELEQSLGKDYPDAISLLKEIASADSCDLNVISEISEGLIRVDEKLVKLEATLLESRPELTSSGKGIERDADLIVTLSEADRAGLEGASRVISYNAGDVIFKEGDFGDALYIIKNGRVIVVVGQSQAEVVIATLCEGNFFGEMALLTSKPRSATVKALTNIVLLRVDKGELGKILYAYPAILMHLANKFEARVKILRELIDRFH